MAGMNVVQKILARAAGKAEIATGEFAIVRSKCPVNLSGDGIGGRGHRQMTRCGARKVFDPQMIKIVMGHAGAGGPVTIGESRARTRRWAEEMGIPRESIFDLGQQGVEHIVAGEQCWALPGEIYLSI